MILALLLACEPPAPPTTPSDELALPAPVEIAWPQAGAPLVEVDLEVPEGFGVHKVYVDPGHGVGTNSGARTCWCEDEQEPNLRVAQHLAAWLERSGHFDVRLSRADHDGPSYTRRHLDAAAWGAQALIGIHADARGEITGWAPWPGASCPRGHGTPGFSVLWSDDGDDSAISARSTLADAVATRMAEAGLLPYDGSDYVGLYLTGAVPGTYIDRRGLAMLRRPATPAIIVETHHALDPEETARWREPATLDAFSAAVGAALVDVLTGR